jgi:isoprenylcysteine carboxyl methyltransferase (ICMT) family protein YpbQ
MNNKKTITARGILELIGAVLVLSILFYLSLVVKIWVAEHRFELNVLKSSSGRDFIIIAIAVTLYYIGRELLNYWKKNRSKNNHNVV